MDRCVFIDECTFDSMTGSALSAVVTNNYKETSRYLLNVLNTQYRFAEHFEGNEHWDVSWGLYPGTVTVVLMPCGVRLLETTCYWDKVTSFSI